MCWKYANLFVFFSFLPDSQYACPEVEFFWRVQQVMKSSSHTLRVQILDREGGHLHTQHLTCTYVCTLRPNHRI